MNKFSEILASVPLESSRKRRELLINTMSSKEEAGLDCSACSGYCCTYSHNSMQVDPIQALEALVGLESEGRVNEKLVESLKSNISKFRLDKDFGLSSSRSLRRFYTCPFFKNESLGCSISRSYKPYGCLSFNANEADVSVEGKCSSDQELLKLRGNQFKSEDGVNQLLIDKMNLWWEKLPFPVALIELISKVYPELKK